MKNVNAFFVKNRPPALRAGLIILLLLLFALSAISCNSSSRLTNAAGDSGAGFAPSPAQSVGIDDALAEIEAAETPASVDEAVYRLLKDELMARLSERAAAEGGRIVSAAPKGDAGKVTSLTFNKTTGVLAWNYANLGDYDISGEVGISDITPIALNYLQMVGLSPQLAWVDGDKSGEIGISDITTIALNYLSAVQTYKMYRSEDGESGWEEFGTELPFGKGGSYPKRFTVNLSPTETFYVAVRATGSGGTLGEMSNVIQVSPDTPTPPSVTGVNPISGQTGQPVSFAATATGTQPFTYQWSFGGGATPDTSTDAAPAVTLGAEGSYNASVIVTNAAGEDTFDFTLTVTGTGDAPAIVSVSPQSGLTGANVQFSAVVSGTLPMTYSWNFGGGASPNTSTVESPSATLGAPGNYNATLTVTNAFGNDTLPFTLTVTEITVTDWVRTWGGSSRDEGYAIAVDSQGSVFAAGRCDSYGAGFADTFFLKFTADGNLAWQRTWGGSNYEMVYGLATDSSGNLYAAGSTSSFGATITDSFVLKFSPDGNLLWQKMWGGSSMDYSNAVATDSAGNVYVAGYTESMGAGQSDAFWLKYSPAGDLLMQKTWGGSGLDGAFSIKVDGAGNVYLGGDTRSYGSGTSAFVVKFNSAGDIQWQNAWGGTAMTDGNFCLGLAVDATGNVYAAGRTRNFGAGGEDAILLKYSSSGALLWQKTWGGTGYEDAKTVSVDGAGNVYIAGATDGFGAGSGDAYLVKFGSSGSMIWQKTWGGTSADAASAIFVESDGRVNIVGVAPNNSGSWGTPGGVVGSPTGKETAASSSGGTGTGTNSTPSGTVGTPSGVLNTGGGGNDALIIKAMLS